MTRRSLAASRWARTVPAVVTVLLGAALPGAASSRIELSASSTVPSVQTPQSTTYCEAQLAILQLGDVLEFGRAAGHPAYSRAFLTVELGAIHVSAKVRLISVSGVVIAERGGLEVEQIRSFVSCLP